MLRVAQHEKLPGGSTYMFLLAVGKLPAYCTLQRNEMSRKRETPRYGF